MKQGSSSERRRAPVSLRQVAKPRKVRASLLMPILSVSRFFVGDSIPRVESATAINEHLKELQTRQIDVTQAAEGLLTKILIGLIRLRDRDPELGRALRLLAGLVFVVIEDD